jgi:predicted  nucleic acid-binding Zn-ribbon protein
MDRLHLEKIEIVSPSFMNQRQVNDVKFIPDSVSKSDDSKSKNSPEDILFDKANVADEIENKEDTLEKVEQQIKDLKDSLGDSENTDAIKNKIKNLEEIREKAEQNINSSKDKLDEHI